MTMTTGQAGVQYRPTTGSAYTDGTGTFHPKERRLVSGRDIADDRTILADVCVIGSGAGGAVAAKELAEGGMNVVVLEEGLWHESSEYNARPREMVEKLYRDSGQTFTVGRPVIVMPVGKAVGGTTVLNSGTCFRTPKHILRRWDEELGLHRFTPQELDPFFRRVEREVNVAQIPAEVAGNNAAIVDRGAKKLGLNGFYLFRNAKGCVGSGVCTSGCPTGAKQHVGITYVPKAWAASATTYTGTRVRTIEMNGPRATEVIGETLAGAKLRVRCEKVIVACGTLFTPNLLRKNKIAKGSRALGRNLSIHPASAVRAQFDERVDMWHGVPQSYGIDDYVEEGIMLETLTNPPDQYSMLTLGFGPEHGERIARAEHTAVLGVIVSDKARGSVHYVGGQQVIHYSLTDQDVAAFKRGCEIAADVLWAAGAKQVTVPIAGVPALQAGDSQPLREKTVRQNDIYAMGFHPLGTARAGADPKDSVVDQNLRVHGTENVYVMDGSVVPTSIAVNPQITIMTLATWMAYNILGAKPPHDEPYPQPATL